MTTSKYGAFRGFGWTPERERALPLMAADGMSGMQIAVALGGGLTRNAVIGVCSRRKIKLKRKAGWHVGAKGPRTPRERISPPVTVRPPRVKAAPLPRPAPPEPVALAEPLPLALGLADLSALTCRWPSDTNDMRAVTFCGHAPFEEHPYCEYHHRLAYRPEAERDRMHRRSNRWVLRVAA